MNKFILTAALALVSPFLLAQIPCSKLFISEYIEGSNNNKAIEIYNPTNLSVDLTGYKILISYNGGSSTQSTDLTGVIIPGSTFLLVHNAADSAALGSIANQTYTPSAWFNGDDAIVLLNNGDTLDILGKVGEQPSSGGWDLSDGGNTKDHSLVRKPGIHTGQKNWALGQDEWISFPQNTFTNAGSHNMDPCPVITEPIISFVNNKQTVAEIDGDVNIKVTIQNPSANPTAITMNLLPGSSATEGADFTFPAPLVVTFPGGSSDTQTVTIPIINDADIESLEFFVLSISDATNNALINLSTDSIFILDDDIAIDPPSVFFLFSQQDCQEGTSSCAVQLEIFGPNANPTSVNVNLLLAQTTATPGTDFTFTNTTVTFPGGSSSSQLIDVGITNDNDVEGNETIALILANPTNNATIGANNKNILSIIDNDPNSILPVTAGAFTIIPNPVKQNTLIASAEYLKTIRVFNTLGQLERSMDELNSTSYYADFSSLLTGIYIVEITTNHNQVMRHRMIKL